MFTLPGLESLAMHSTDPPTAMIVPVQSAHRAVWSQLYAAFADSQSVAQTKAMRERVWAWLQDPAHPVEGLIALNVGKRPIGLAHFRVFPCPLSAAEALFLDDLYVDRMARGQGIGAALLAALQAEAARRGLPLVRWSTLPQNAAACALYDRLAVRVDHLLYDLPARSAF